MAERSRKKSSSKEHKKNKEKKDQEREFTEAYSKYKNFENIAPTFLDNKIMEKCLQYCVEKGAIKKEYKEDGTAVVPMQKPPLDELLESGTLVMMDKIAFIKEILSEFDLDYDFFIKYNASHQNKLLDWVFLYDDLQDEIASIKKFEEKYTEWNIKKISAKIKKMLPNSCLENIRPWYILSHMVSAYYRNNFDWICVSYRKKLVALFLYQDNCDNEEKNNTLWMQEKRKPAIQLLIACSSEFNPFNRYISIFKNMFKQFFISAYINGYKTVLLQTVTVEAVSKNQEYGANPNLFLLNVYSKLGFSESNDLAEKFECFAEPDKSTSRMNTLYINLTYLIFISCFYNDEHPLQFVAKSNIPSILDTRNVRNCTDIQYYPYINWCFNDLYENNGASTRSKNDCLNLLAKTPLKSNPGHTLFTNPQDFVFVTHQNGCAGKTRPELGAVFRESRYRYDIGYPYENALRAMGVTDRDYYKQPSIVNTESNNMLENILKFISKSR